MSNFKLNFFGILLFLFHLFEKAKRRQKAESIQEGLLRRINLYTAQIVHFAKLFYPADPADPDSMENSVNSLLLPTTPEHDCTAPITMAILLGVQPVLDYFIRTFTIPLPIDFSCDLCGQLGTRFRFIRNWSSEYRVYLLEHNILSADEILGDFE